jgi:hypothetical protein
MKGRLADGRGGNPVHYILQANAASHDLLATSHEFLVAALPLPGVSAGRVWKKQDGQLCLARSTGAARKTCLRLGLSAHLLHMAACSRPQRKEAALVYKEDYRRI